MGTSVTTSISFQLSVGFVFLVLLVMVVARKIDQDDELARIKRQRPGNWGEVSLFIICILHYTTRIAVLFKWFVLFVILEPHVQCEQL